MALPRRSSETGLSSSTPAGTTTYNLPPEPAADTSQSSGPRDRHPGAPARGRLRRSQPAARSPQPGLQELDTLFDQILVLFTGLLFLAIIIAVLGITNTLTLAIIERAREIGLFLRWAVVRALAQEGLGSFAVPIGQIAILALLAGVAGVIAAIYPSWKASRLNTLDAIAYE